MAAPTQVPGVLFEIRGRVAIVTINQPKKLNALSQDLYFHIAQLLRYIDTRDDVVITVLTGKGRFFSAGADVTLGGKSQAPSDASEQYRQLLRSFVADNLNITHAFYTHKKIFVAALNGPVVGLSAAIVGHADFVYAAPHTYLLCPFSSLGLVAEGLASRALVNRLGPARGNEALLMSKRITCEELVQCGFVNKVFQGQPGDDDSFLKVVLQEVNERLGDHLNSNSLIKIKGLLRAPDKDMFDAQGVKEVFGGLEVLMKGIPQEEFRKIASGEKRHKL